MLTIAPPHGASPAVPFTIDADLDLGACMEPWLRVSGADVTIRRGGVPTALPDPEAGGVVWQHAGRRTLLSPPFCLRGPGGRPVALRLARSLFRLPDSGVRRDGGLASRRPVRRDASVRGARRRAWRGGPAALVRGELTTTAVRARAG